MHKSFDLNVVVNAKAYKSIINSSTSIEEIMKSDLLKALESISKG